MSTDQANLDTTRKLRTDAKKRIVKALCEALPDIVEGMEFYQITGDSYSAYKVADVHSFRIVLSIKTDSKKLRTAGG